MRNFYSEPSRIRGDFIDLDPGEAHHARDVLRLRPGETVRVLDGAGHVYLGTWDPGGGRVHIEQIMHMPPFHCEVTLAVALLKGERWDWLLQKGVEIGVSCIVPLLARHSVVRVREGEFEERRERWKQIAVSALKQSGQPFLPAIALPATVDDFCRSVSTGARWMLSERGGAALKSVLTPQLTRLSVLVGPEGGWSDVELEASRREGFEPVSLGPAVLRAETAPLYVLSVVRFVTG